MINPTFYLRPSERVKTELDERILEFNQYFIMKHNIPIKYIMFKPEPIVKTVMFYQVLVKNFISIIFININFMKFSTNVHIG